MTQQHQKWRGQTVAIMTQVYQYSARINPLFKIYLLRKVPTPGFLKNKTKQKNPTKNKNKKSHTQLQFDIYTSENVSNVDLTDMSAKHIIFNNAHYLENKFGFRQVALVIFLEMRQI